MKLFAAAVWSFILLASGAVSAQTALVYVNGIHVTMKGARDASQAMAQILNASTTRTGSSKRTFVAEYVYNPIGFNGTNIDPDFAQDKMELFLLKTAEEFYAASFARLLAPYNASSSLDQAAAIDIKRRFVDDLTPGPATNSLERNGQVKENDLLPTYATILGIVSKLRSGNRIFVGHSQGNLLLNLAWAAFVAEVGQGAQKTVRFVNVANTSQFAVSGLNLTHAQDRILEFGLTTLPSSGRNWTRNTPTCLGDAACDFLLAEPTFGGGPMTLVGHFFLETYLSTSDLPNVLVQQGVVYSQGKTRFRDRFEDLVYAAAQSIDGPSQIDEGCVFTREPSGTLKLVIVARGSVTLESGGVIDVSPQGPGTPGGPGEPTNMSTSATAPPWTCYANTRAWTPTVFFLRSDDASCINTTAAAGTVAWEVIQTIAPIGDEWIGRAEMQPGILLNGVDFSLRAPIKCTGP